MTQRYEEAAAAYAEARDILSAPGRAGGQPAVAMVIYKLGCVAFEQSNYTGAAYVASIAYEPSLIMLFPFMLTNLQKIPPSIHWHFGNVSVHSGRAGAHAIPAQ